MGLAGQVRTALGGWLPDADRARHRQTRIGIVQIGRDWSHLPGLIQTLFGRYCAWGSIETLAIDVDDGHRRDSATSMLWLEPSGYGNCPGDIAVGDGASEDACRRWYAEVATAYIDIVHGKVHQYLSAIEGWDHVLVISRLGGTMERIAFPFATSVARRFGGKHVTALAALPFHFEGAIRRDFGRGAFNSMLRNGCDCVIKIEYTWSEPSPTLRDVFHGQEQILMSAIRGYFAYFEDRRNPDALVPAGFHRIRSQS